MAVTGFVVNGSTHEKFVTFYDSEPFADFNNDLLNKVYEARGINIPFGEMIKNYPQLQGRGFIRVYPGDGELFQKVFLQYELKRYNKDGQLAFIDLQSNEQTFNVN